MPQRRPPASHVQHALHRSPVPHHRPLPQLVRGRSSSPRASRPHGPPGAGPCFLGFPRGDGPPQKTGRLPRSEDSPLSANEPTPRPACARRRRGARRHPPDVVERRAGVEEHRPVALDERAVDVSHDRVPRDRYEDNGARVPGLAREPAPVAVLDRLDEEEAPRVERVVSSASRSAPPPPRATWA
jgi:hypothetical protein